jgi:hypothetical protein
VTQLVANGAAGRGELTILRLIPAISCQMLARRSPGVPTGPRFLTDVVETRQLPPRSRPHGLGFMP